MVAPYLAQGVLRLLLSDACKTNSWPVTDKEQSMSFGDFFKFRKDNLPQEFVCNKSVIGQLLFSQRQKIALLHSLTPPPT